ncbi:DnaT-like ssDNA-binding domain-containing protein [Paraglaciecola hydrolytica]|uniref:Flavodoxin n=1 Tax=Paraglaciecola hydrolytica TaxID=1799789 RepID=A0A136A467_9ALTE|nr:DnaT-like ssDNA-binding domain-containing protein [Paraglaciecola hydrolytica]KXI30032.1 flavodoxin [Paraglaciecola hydrolytica]
MNINEAEQQALLQALSNDARTLYLLGIKPSVDKTTAISEPLNYKNLLKLLNGKEHKFTLGRQINSLIKELLHVGLVSFEQDVELNHSFNGKTLVLPLTLTKADDYSRLHLEWQSMQLNWQPDKRLIQDLAKLMGIIDYQHTDLELGDFIAYWLGRPESHFTQFQWTQKFVFNLKHKRLAHGTSTVHKVGQQLVQAKAGIVADENAKKLVEKYSKKNV